MSFIYLAVYSDGTSYVGQTTNTFEGLEKRYASYTKKNTMKRSPAQRACFALGMPALGVIEYCPPEKLDERERYWIEVHRQDGKNLNVADGGGAQTKRQRSIADKLRRMESKLAKAARRQRR